MLLNQVLRIKYGVRSQCIDIYGGFLIYRFLKKYIFEILIELFYDMEQI